MEKINFKNVTFQYPLAEKPALKQVSFQVKPSEFIVVCGKSGCGKSTLLRHLKKNLMPYGQRSGEILYEGIAIEQLDDRRSASEIGFVQQNPDHQLVTDKVWHELAFGLESLGLPVKVIKRRVAEMTSYFGIQTWFRKDVSQLSGGQKQLLNLASVMAMQPQILILDEPASQLDPIAASDFLQTVYKINRDLGTTVIISEHRLEEVFPMADRVMVMDSGEIAAFDTPGRIGHILSGDGKSEPHPMFFGLPAVMRMFEPLEHIRENTPLTIREGRIHMEEFLANLPEEKKAETADTGAIWTKETKRKEKQAGKALRESRLKNKTDAAIVLKDLWFRYEKKLPDVLRGLSFEVKKGEWYCLLGGNGTGKSTTLKAICNAITPQRGRITVDGITVKKETEAQLFDHRLAMVPQNPQSLFTEITVEEELLEGMAFIPYDAETKIKNVERMLDMMGIAHLRKANPYDLSGGEQQRLAIGKILLLKPSVLLMDEPTKGLDPFFKRNLAKILGQLKSQGVTIFMVSHDIEFCAAYADVCAMFFDGEIVAQAPPAEFFAGNNFYTTTANKIVRKWHPEMVTCEEVTRWLQELI
ncbi:Putative HMP/thiamine import ATP-binding protein YkoD [uncultured Roseburia sp.]|uniref:Energy-coupling factor transporter ATPase n=1 Tax=Brotonthovivens ammoniilytica TaxID=2981725 RepID=A0ABT2TK85_9FIRM|nr:ATP-binding cassette domain-containing protein [Brotonthovivens ammoniilytica]MCU6762619.1 energy-coupling factor transporter ATPase [Brotonthovivens ammoniilytica]SCI77546.1 Putative HMP/thiamine import ATP-binding protein YkoD [uncultured Roseburia sp.]